MKGNKKLFLIFTILITIIEHFLFYEDNNNCPKLKCSSSGICVDNYAQCPTPMACGKEFKKINQFTCSKYDVLLESQKCTKITCWNNDCVNDTKLCPTMSSCPNKYLIKCHDNSCVENLDDCPKYVNCPKFIPIRCPNGDCRRNFEDCPSLTQCPSDFPILCNDNSCRITAEECEKPAENTRCIGRSMVRCSDGTCKSSKFLCTTPKTCPIGKVLCFNGICADYYQDCLSKSTIDRSTTCSSIGKLRCELDGSCRNDINDCPTSVICPVERPVKCWDNSCKENIHKCPPYQTCPINFLECPNGTCIYSKDGKGGSCGTMITCSLDAPFKCKDNTCKRTPNDCESNDDCPTEKPVLCWDGSCVSNRIDCIKLSDCDISKPVRCPDFQCRSSVEECKEISGCPLGFVRCDDKTCKRKSSDCNVAKCPINFPFMCKLGNCVKNIEECDVEETACPFYAPIKCENSSKCVDKQELCPDNENKKIPNDSKICPDGSIILKELECPLANGCPAKKPLLCANNECRISCKIATCPKETPIKCLNGECVLSETNCPSSYDFHTSKECEGRNLITCANGQCARYAEECKPISVCPKDMKMCPNGTCRNLELNCPDENTCPIGLPYRCPNGKCVASNDSCLNMSGCPLGKNYKCITNGLCVSNQSDCSNYDKKFPLANGCDNDKPFKCSNGKCAADKDSCEEKLCDGDKVFCPNSGLCMSSLNECKKSKCTQIICPTNGLCVDTLEKCKTMQNCDSNTPYRCLDGQCKKFSFNFNSYSESLYCQSRVECPSYRPYLCADGSCMEKSSFCKPLVDCPEEAKIRCPDRTCVEKYEDCNKSDFQIICPPTNPILCSNNGNCVKNIFDCFEEKCPDWLPVKCISGLCVSSPRECVYKMNLISSVNDPNSNFNLTMKISCKSTDHVCYDGSCKEKPEYCPTFDGCNNINSPYKCPSGKCAKDKKSCLRDLYNNENRENELVNVTCEKGFNLCDDGICRIKCPVTNSCKNDSPYLCSNGNCVKDINECAGDSKCEIGKPFRCVDGTCQEKLSSCRKPKKLEASTDIRLFVSPGRDFKADILVDDFNDIIGSIYMPANTFTLKKTNNNETNSTQANIPSNEVISIKTIPIRTEFLYKTTKDYSEIARDIVNKLFPYGDENDTMKLEFQYAILSPVLDINFLSNKTEINQDIVLRLAYDLQSIYLDPELGQIKDKVCLAYLDRNDSGWKCVEKIITSNEPSGNFYEGKIKNSGLYSIALDINIEINSTEKPQNWIMKNFRLFVVLIGSGIFLFFVLIYIFHRIYRYRAKYIITKKKYIEMEDKEASMKEKTTHFKGQTIKDTEENMMYTDNLCKQKKNDQNNQSKNSRLEYLRSVEDSYFHKIKVFENNFDKLTKELDAAYDRYEKLKEYSNILREGRNLLSDNEKE